MSGLTPPSPNRKGSIICETEVTFVPGANTNSSVAEEMRNGYSAIEATGLQLIPVSQSGMLVQVIGMV